ncbi:Root phototropism 1 [Hyphodiscus hymeniophilus]|uniref:Root phototropism 1 n=1 Tax=Hyphodiscus hymeniophilus TaxID=353542 RepID=A0A9P6VKS4_9HELO|nr:Root phototropism 1 [Hyphodiscus hymeniophilus]
MSHLYLPEMSDAIDQVIQSGQSLHTIQESPRGTASNVGINRTMVSPLYSPGPARSSRSRPSSPRQEQMSFPLRSNPPASPRERSGSRSDRGDRDNLSPKMSSSRGYDQTPGSSNSETLSGSPPTGRNAENITDFFSPEVFQIVIHNPTTAHRFLKFCQSRACGENMEFLQKVDVYNRALDDIAQILSSIHSTYTSPDAPRQINLAHSYTKRLSVDIKQATSLVLPGMESIFAGAQAHIETLLATDIYPRFVRHQVTASATAALADHRERFQGLGDCFCVTDPLRADNPITFASDGFVAVTGYSRRDIIPRNCRFLQGEMTDSRAPKRLRASIDNCEETVELLLNYRKNGDPFWNLLYVAPLLNERGEVVLFLGGQINCSTTIHSCSDILKVLSVNDEELDQQEELGRNKPPSIRSQQAKAQIKPRSNFFKSFRKYSPNTLPTTKLSVKDEAGMEPELVNRLGKLSFKTQVEAFYTAYSKYLVLAYNRQTQYLTIQHYSPGVIDMLGLNLPNGSIAPIFNKDIFRILVEHSPPSTSVAKNFKTRVRDSISRGKAVSIELAMLTGYEERKERSGLGRMLGDRGDSGRGLVRVEEQYATHWTPLKDEEGRTGWVVLTIAPKM